MDKYDELRRKKEIAFNGAEQDIKNLSSIAKESKRVGEVSKNVHIIIKDIDRQFAEATKLNKMDVSFLFFATALQCTRQYLWTYFKERVSDQEAAKQVKKNGEKESSQRAHRWYRPSLVEISTNPVPYDASFGSPDFHLGLSGKQHRFRTLGHDPLLGWIFGTANIATSTLTTWDFQSYHVKTGYTAIGHARDKITNNAKTSKVFEYTYDRLQNQGMEGKIAIVESLRKQGQHIRSDEYSKMGLPIPGVSTLSPDLAQRLAEEHKIDFANTKTILQQGAMAALINTLIAMIHSMFYDEEKYGSRSLYETKTRKILSYSNTIASTSNIVYVAFSKDMSKLDIGGFAVTLYRLVQDHKFIKNIKEEFLEKEFYNRVLGEEYYF